MTHSSHILLHKQCLLHKTHAKMAEKKCLREKWLLSNTRARNLCNKTLSLQKKKTGL